MRIEELFDVKYGVNLELENCQCIDSKDGINFVARTSVNNGVVAKVAKIEGIEPQAAGTLSCAAGGSVLATFLQMEPYYSGRDLYILTPKREMSLNEKLYYCMCIQSNAYKYSYGRQANKTLKDIVIPDVEMWRNYQLKDLFDFVKGKRLTKEDITPGKINFLGAISDNNGVREQIETEWCWEGNCITVNYNGSVGEAFYQEKKFWASDDVNILYAKKAWKMNKFIALFMITVIKANKYRFSYGRKWTMEKMKDSIIKLPSKSDGTPDFEYMEEFIKSLPYSDRI